jgi:hypothetical protein
MHCGANSAAKIVLKNELHLKTTVYFLGKTWGLRLKNA